MDQMVTKIVVVAVILLIVTGIVVPRIMGRRHSARRARDMAALAESQGWAYSAENEQLVPLVQRLPQALGRARELVTSAIFNEPARLDVGSRILHAIDGAVDLRRILIFDWLAGHGTGAGRASLVFLHTVWAIPLPHVPFWVQAASKAQPHDRWRAGQVFRTGDDAFDKRFLTTAADGGHVPAGLTPQTRRLLLESGFDGWRLDPELQMLLVWTHSTRRFTPVDQVLPMTRLAARLASEAIAPTRG